MQLARDSPAPSPSSLAVSPSITQSPAPPSVTLLLPQSRGTADDGPQEDADFPRSPKDSLQRKSRRRSLFAVQRNRTRDVDDEPIEGDPSGAQIQSSAIDATPEQRQSHIFPPVELLVAQYNRPSENRNWEHTTASTSHPFSERISSQPAIPQNGLPNGSSVADNSPKAANVLAKDAEEREQARHALTALVQGDSEQTYEGKSHSLPEKPRREDLRDGHFTVLYENQRGQVHSATSRHTLTLFRPSVFYFAVYHISLP